jgi:(p)ppGpp synthase/HD superfamily hydrolase
MKHCDLDGVDLTLKAKYFAIKKHNGKKDDEGKDYFDCHCSVVGEILMNVTEDAEIIAAAYLHDTLEDTNTTYDELIEHFGRHVADLVLEVTHAGKTDEHGYFFPNLKSRDAIMIKFADRLSNISRMSSWDVKRQEDYLKKSKFWKSE